jgi:DNA-binding transcriptional ArsR family regulator
MQVTMPRAVQPFKAEANLLSTLAHPARLQILESLREGEACVCHIQAALGHRQAYVSQQLMALREARLVSYRKDGLRVYYQLADPHILDVLREVQALAYPGQARPVGAVAPPRGQCNCPRCNASGDTAKH